VGLPELQQLRRLRNNRGSEHGPGHAWPGRSNPGAEHQSVAAAAEDNRPRAFTRGHPHGTGGFLNAKVR
jgi:hypothetical protein